MLRIGGIAVAVLVAGALAGCGGSSGGGASSGSSVTSGSQSGTSLTASTEAAGPVDVGDIEDRIAALLRKPTSSTQPATVQAITVDCPDAVEAETGKSFDCNLSGAVAGGAPLTGSATVTLQDDAGKKFSLKYKFSGGAYTSEGTSTSVT